MVEVERFKPLLDAAIHPFSDEYSLEAGVPVTRGKKYANSGRSVRGAAIAWTELNDGSREVFVSLPASVLAEASLQEIWEISALLKFSYGVKFTRVDLRIDDYSKQLNPDLMLKAFQDGNYANFRTLDKIQRWKSGVEQGFTLYFGHPKSEKRARFYDKSAESKGVMDCYRLETQLRRGSAQGKRISNPIDTSASGFSKNIK